MFSSCQSPGLWWYHDYIQVGSPESSNQAFQTLTKTEFVSGSWQASKDEMHYAYDAAGRLRVASFGQRPLSTSPLSNGSYYDYSNSTTWASSRARAVYVYDPSGRTISVDHYWDYPNTGGSGYLTDYLLGNSCDYLDYTGLKHTSTFWIQGTGGTAVKDKIGTSDHVETYGYDANLDYLTSTQYVTGGSTTSWSYDAAGNRNDATVVDNLNRATTIGGVSRTYDILGNTTAIGSHSMQWDCLNRMTQYNNGANSIANTYRADGMRVRKANLLTPSVYTDYAYDGQMPIEEYNYRNTYPTSAPLKLIRYGLGARGVDWIERTDANTNVVTTGYPIYDAHGNMVATLEKVPTDSWAINDQRNYDAWGGIINGSTSGEPNGRYCPNIGHLQDDESGFVYMRARYYEPGTGRFLSEDPSSQGRNWYAYCDNDPGGKVDGSGRVGEASIMFWHIIAAFLDSAAFVHEFFFPKCPTVNSRIGWNLVAATGLAITFIDLFVGLGEMEDSKVAVAGSILCMLLGAVFATIVVEQLVMLLMIDGNGTADPTSLKFHKAGYRGVPNWEGGDE